MKIVVLFLFSFSIYGLCDYPHNPPFLCLEGKITSVKPIKSKNFKCLVKADVRSLNRPIGAYSFNKNLDKKVFTDKDLIKKDEISFYSNLNCEKKNIFTILEYNCSEKNGDLKDLSLLDLHKSKSVVIDQWNEKKTKFDCSIYLPRPVQSNQ